MLQHQLYHYWVKQLYHNITSIIRILAKTYPDILHSLDVWHKAKKLKKLLCEVYTYYNIIIYCHWDRLGRKKACKTLQTGQTIFIIIFGTAVKLVEKMKR